MMTPDTGLMTDKLHGIITANAEETRKWARIQDSQAGQGLSKNVRK